MLIIMLQIREIMSVLDTKFDTNLQENLTRSQNSVTWAWIYCKCKKQLFENSYLLRICHCGMSKNMQKLFFPIFWSKYPKMHSRSQKSFFVNLKQWLTTFRSNSLLPKYYAWWNNWAQCRYRNTWGGGFRLKLLFFIGL